MIDGRFPLTRSPMALDEARSHARTKTNITRGIGDPSECESVSAF
jgi:hypothetical protein